MELLYRHGNNTVHIKHNNCERSNVTGANTKPDQLGRDNLARTDPAVGAMVLPPVSIISFEVVQNDSIAYLVGFSITTVKPYATIHKTQQVLYFLPVITCLLNGHCCIFYLSLSVSLMVIVVYFTCHYLSR